MRYIKVKNEEVAQAIIAYAIMHNFPVYGPTRSDYEKGNVLGKRYIGFVVHGDLCRITKSDSLEDGQEVKSIAKFLSLMSSKRRVQLNNELVANVKANCIEVGCQSISFEAFDRLAEVVKSVRK